MEEEESEAESPPHRRCKRLERLAYTKKRTKAQLMAAWERPFREGISACFSSGSILEKTGFLSAKDRRATATSVLSRASKLRMSDADRRSTALFRYSSYHRSTSSGMSRSSTRRKTTASSKSIEERERVGRITENIVTPTRYRLCLKPHLETLRFDGSVLIEFGPMRNWDSQDNLTNPAPLFLSRLVLNALDLHIEKVAWADETTMDQQEASSVVMDSKTERVTLEFDKPVTLPGVLIINFSGHILEGTSGFYRSTVTTTVGQTTYCGVTKFEPTFARKCFPCLDEPGTKSKFDLSLILPKHLTAISNQPIQAIVPHRTNTHLHVIEFEPTPAMAPHQLTFAIGEFEVIEGHADSAPDFVDIKIHTSGNKTGKAQLALECTQACLEFYHFYFELPLEMRKLDLLSLTSHGDCGVANWGVATFAENQLLQKHDGDIEEGADIALLVSREVAHQWIGSLVGIDWWSRLWLRDGLATLLAYMSIEYFEPKFQIWRKFAADVMARALEADALRSTHSLEPIVSSPLEIQTIFDDIANDKGAAIMRMIQGFVGEKTFQTGIQTYLKRFGYKSASTADFLLILEEVSEKPVATIFETWIKRSGFPIIKVESSQLETGGVSRVVIIRQEPFAFSLEPIHATPKMRRSDNHRCQWIIPIHMSLSSAPSQPVKEFIMDKPAQKFRVNDTNPNDWFMLNPGFVGFYRVKYPPEMIGKFLKAIRLKQFAMEDRLGLLNDLHALTSVGVSTTMELFTMLESFVDEDEYLVWKEINTVVASLDLLLQSDECYPKFKLFSQNVFRKIHAKLGWKAKADESSADKKLRLMVLQRLLRFGKKTCVEEGYRQFRQWLNGSSIELPQIAFQAGIADSENHDEVFRTLVRHFKDSQYFKEKADIIQSFGFAETEEAIMAILDFTVSDVVNTEETVVIMDGLMQNAIAKPLAWTFFKNHVAVFQKRFHGVSDLEGKLIQTVTKYLATSAKPSDVATFFQRHNFNGTENIVQESLDKMKLYAAWFKRDKLQIEEYLGPYED